MGGSFRDEESGDPRALMVATQVAARGVRDGRVLEAMMSVPRELFVPPETRARAYQDSPQRLACGQTISQPFIVGRMLELLELTSRDRVLEVGAGTGYQAALLGRLAAHVVTMERHPELAHAAEQNLRTLEAGNVEVRVGDGSLGAPDRAPFDAIIVACAAPDLPPALLAQLAPGGRMICPVGGRSDQRLVRVRRMLDGRRDVFEDLEPVVFVPLVGAEGFASDER